MARAYDRFVGRGEAAVTIPAMDGALRPHGALDAAAVLLAAPAPDNLALDGASVLFSSGTALWRIAPGGGGEIVAQHGAVIAALATAPGGGLAVATEDGRVVLPDGPAVEIACPTALAFAGAALLVAQGSARHPPGAWKRDLMEHGRSGAIWRVPLAGGPPALLADGLAWPYGLLVQGDTVLVSESWRHRVLRLPLSGGKPAPVVQDLPGYPARLAPAPGGGAWLAVFAPRSQLIEFVLREPGYRARMMEEVDLDHWIAPALSSGHSFLEPLQGGAVKQMGILKPWAPARSYGLAIRLDDQLEPQESLHSRADGRRHGIASVLQRGGELLAASRGGDVILSVRAGRG